MDPSQIDPTAFFGTGSLGGVGIIIAILGFFFVMKRRKTVNTQGKVKRAVYNERVTEAKKDLKVAEQKSKEYLKRIKINEEHAIEQRRDIDRTIREGAGRQEIIKHNQDSIKKTEQQMRSDWEHL